MDVSNGGLGHAIEVEGLVALPVQGQTENHKDERHSI